jgi:hypothetical protein
MNVLEAASACQTWRPCTFGIPSLACRDLICMFLCTLKVGGACCGLYKNNILIGMGEDAFLAVSLGMRRDGVC